jgi:retron-type reverse transcriptase
MNQRNLEFNSVGGGIRCKIFHNIFDDIISLENLFSTWEEFKRGKRNKPDVPKFEYNLEANIFQLQQELKAKTYKHSNYNSFYIQDPKLRRIHKACVKDRVLHHAIFRILYPIFDPTFISDSYSCRIKKGTHKAVNRLQQFARKVSKNNTKNCYILKCDVKKFFDSIDHDILISLIQKRIRNNETIWLIEEIIKSFSISPNKGLPLGNITSQLFANIYLNELDQFIKHALKVKYYIRYCDDFVILSNNNEYLKELILTINDFLKEKLKLSLHSDKIKIRKYHQGIDFLGYVSFPYYRILRTKTKRRMFKKIQQRIKELKRGEISKESFNQTIQSYFGALKHCNSHKVIQNIINLIYEF